MCLFLQNNVEEKIEKLKLLSTSIFGSSARCDQKSLDSIENFKYSDEMIIILQGNNQIRFENSESNHERFDLIRNFQIMAPAKILPSNQIKSRNFQIAIQIILNQIRPLI